eukprot:gene9791-11438_t
MSEGTIKTLLKEIDDITAYSYNNCQHVIAPDNKSFSTISMDGLRELIKSYPLFEQLLDVPNQSPDTTAPATNYTFAELSQHMLRINEPFTPPTGMIEFGFKCDEKISESFIKDVTDMYSKEVIDVISKLEADATNPHQYADIYLVGAKTMAYAPANGSWRDMPSKCSGGSYSTKNGCVHTGSHLYQFCANSSPNVLHRLDLTTNVSELLSVTLTRQYPSACYDDQQFIYLLGGAHVTNIDRYDTKSNTIQSFGQMPITAYNLFSHFCQDSNSIYYWGGIGSNNNLVNHNIYELNISTATSHQLLTINFTIPQIFGSCYDHKEYFYVLTQHYLFKVSKNGKGEPIFLTPPPQNNTNTTGSMIYAYVQGSYKILVFNANHLLIYDIDLNQWRAETTKLTAAENGVVGWRMIKKTIV